MQESPDQKNSRLRLGEVGWYKNLTIRLVLIGTLDAEGPRIDRIGEAHPLSTDRVAAIEHVFAIEAPRQTAGSSLQALSGSRGVIFGLRGKGGQ
jgi:hypothetical protein